MIPPNLFLSNCVGIKNNPLKNRGPFVHQKFGSLETRPVKHISKDIPRYFTGTTNIQQQIKKTSMYRKNISHRIAFALFMLLIALIFSNLISCKSIEAAKDRKAIGRVLSSPDLTAQVGKLLPPCVNDTIVTSDTVIELTTRVEHDTSYVLVNDTVVKTVTETQYVDKWRERTKVVADTRLAQQWRDSADKYRNSYIAKDAQYQAALQQLSNAEAKAKLRGWLMWLLPLVALFIGRISKRFIAPKNLL